MVRPEANLRKDWHFSDVYSYWKGCQLTIVKRNHESFRNKISDSCDSWKCLVFGWFNNDSIQVQSSFPFLLWDTGCPRKNDPVADCSSRRLDHFYWDTLYLMKCYVAKKYLVFKTMLEEDKIYWLHFYCVLVVVFFYPHQCCTFSRRLWRP